MINEDREEAATFWSTYYPAFVSQYRDEGVTDFDVLERYDDLYERRKAVKRIGPHYDVMFFWRPEKEFDKYYTYYPEASGLPEYADMSFYVMVHESFNPSLTSRADNVYANRKPRKRHTFDTVRLFYEGIGIGLRRAEE